MKTTIQQVVLWLAIAAALGLGIGGVILAGSSHSIGARLSEQELDVTRSITGATSIDVSATSARIFVHESSTGSISVRLHGQIIGTKSNLPLLESELHGGTAYIKVRYPRHTIPFSFAFSEDLALDIYIPKTMLKQARFDSVSGSIMIDSVQSNELTIKTVSGAIQARSLSGGRISVESTSRRIVLESVRANDFIAKNVSGGIHISRIETRRASAETASGNIVFGRFAGELDTRSISGDIEVTFAKLTADVLTKSTSGRVRLHLPADASFKLDAASVSGEIDCNFPITSAGAHNGKELTGTVAGGSHLVNAHTISGEIEIARQ